LQEALIHNLVDWVQTAPNPLQSYAAGLLASAMEIQDLAAIFKDSNATLVIGLISLSSLSYAFLQCLSVFNTESVFFKVFGFSTY